MKCVRILPPNPPFLEFYPNASADYPRSALDAREWCGFPSSSGFHGVFLVFYILKSRSEICLKIDRAALKNTFANPCCLCTTSPDHG